MYRLLAFVLAAASAIAATGSVVYSGSAIGSTGAFGTTLSAAFDRDVTTVWYGASSNGMWAGVDFGGSTPVQLTAYRIGNAIDGSSGQKNELAGGQVQASNDCTFGSGVSTLDTIPAPAPGVAYLARYAQGGASGVGAGLPLRNQRSIAPGSPFRCYRYLSAPNGFGGISELQLIGAAGAAGVSARPVMPIVTPGAGVFTSGSVTITMASATTSAAMYFTTDGSTPSNVNGTLYAGAFSLSVGSATLLQAVAYDASLSTPLSDVVPANFRNYAFKPNDNWYDDQGYLIEAHSADISGPFSGRYYMVGQFANKGNNGSNDVPGNEGIWMYSSGDLLNWRWEGQILDTGASAGTSWLYTERPHIVHNVANNNYVLWCHMDNNHDATDRAGVAIATSPTGPWAWQTVTLNPDSSGFKDFSLFVDTNGTAYVAYVTQTGGAQGPVTISQLNSTYTATTGSGSVTGLVTGEEAPVLFVRNGVYFLVSSGEDYYDSVNFQFVLRYIVCSCGSPLGSWGGGGPGATLFASSPAANAPYNGQTASFVTPSGRAGAYFLATDFFNPVSLYASRQSWLPLTFPTSTTVQANQPGGTTPWSLYSQWAPSPGLHLMPMSISH